MSDAENGLENERKKRATERSKGKMYAFISDHTDSITPHELITKKTRQKKTYIVENTRDTRSKRATVCDNTSTAKRIKY